MVAFRQALGRKPAFGTNVAFGCVALLFVALVPAIIKATLGQVSLRGRSATPLWLRLPMQVLFIAMALWMALA